MNTVLVKYRLEMSRQKIMPKLMGDAKSLKSRIIDVCGIRDCILLATPDQHSRCALTACWLWLDQNPQLFSDVYRINWQDCNGTFRDKSLGDTCSLLVTIRGYHHSSLRERILVRCARIFTSSSAIVRSSALKRP